MTCLSWSRCSCGTWWACSPGSSRPGPWWPRAGCYHDWRWPAGEQAEEDQVGTTPCSEPLQARQVASSPSVTFTICCFSVGVTKSPRTSLTTCLRFVACDIINGEDQLLPPAGDNTERHVVTQLQRHAAWHGSSGWSHVVQIQSCNYCHWVIINPAVWWRPCVSVSWTQHLSNVCESVIFYSINNNDNNNVSYSWRRVQQFPELTLARKH